MPDFERQRKFFRGGTTGFSVEHLTRDDLMLLFADLFDLLLYQKIDSQPSFHSVDSIYTDNETFWRDALRKKHFQTMRIELRGFHLMEWLPSAPGRYFTRSAQQEREIAAHEYDFELHEYRPGGKSHMVRGGIGSIRLSAKQIGSGTMYFLGASSTGISHQGIPLVLHETDYASLIRIIHAYGGCIANIVGKLQLFQASLRDQPFYGSELQYDVGVPRYYLVAEHVDVMRPSNRAELLATVAIAFPSSRDTTVFKKAWSYASFHPGSTDELEAAVEWLKDYVERYSHSRHVPILADFDEHHQHFAHPIEFPLKDVFSGTIDTERFEDYKTHWDLDLGVSPQGVNRFSQSHMIPGHRHAWAEERNQPQPLPSYRAANVFLSYAHEDEHLVTELKKQLYPLQRQGYINIWYDREIMAGQERHREIREQLNKAHVILLLVSPDYLNSEYCSGGELQHALELHAHGQAQVIPVILRPVYWQGTPFGSLQALPKNAKPVTDPGWYNLDSALYAVAEGVRRVILQLTTCLSSSALIQTGRTEQASSDQPMMPSGFALVRTLVGHLEGITSLAISADGQILAGLDRKGTVELWNPHTGQLLSTFARSSDLIRSIAISSGSQTLVSGSEKGRIERWDLRTGQLLQVLNIRCIHPIYKLAISPDEQTLLLSDSVEQTIRLYSLQMEEERHAVHIAVYPSNLTVSHDGQSFFTPGPDETFKQWSMQTGELMYTFAGDAHEIRFLAVSADGQRLASGSLKTIKLWDMRARQLRQTLNSESGAYALTCMAMRADGQTLVCGERFGASYDEEISLWDLSSGQRLRRVTIPARRHLVYAVAGPDHQFFVGSVDKDWKQGAIDVWEVDIAFSSDAQQDLPQQ